MKVVVVGAGLGGLSAACHLIGAGHDVVVVERDDAPGGRAGRIEIGGYRFDTGPTVLTMPGILADTFAAAGCDMGDFVTLRPVDPMYRACFADGSTIRVRRGREEMAEEIRQTCGPIEAAAFHRFCAWLTELYGLEMSSFIDRNYDTPLDLVRPIGPAVRLLRLGGLRRLGPTVASYFRDERLQRLFSFQALYAGLDPYRALALYAVITYMDTVEGVYFPEGGMHALATGLAAAAEKAGVDFRYGQPAERVVLTGTTSGPVQGVRLRSGELLAADAVVCNLDQPVAYRALLPGMHPPAALRRAKYSPSAVVWHAGMKNPPPAGAAHHNLHFGKGWNESFDALLRGGTLMPDPSLLISVPTLTDPSLAPSGHSVVYGLEPVPNLNGRVDWSVERTATRDRIAARVAALGYGEEIEAEAFFDPVDWRRLGMAAGTPFSLSHTFFQSGPFRPANIDRRAPGLIFAGSATVPGVGVPMVLLSGRLAAERVGTKS